MIKNLFKSFNGIYFFYLLSVLIFLFFFSKYMLPDGFVLAGHDSGLALDSKSFLETRLWAWDERINFGEDNSLLFGSLTLHAIDYLSSEVAGSSYAGNEINLFFWLAVIFSSSFIFAYQFRNRVPKTFIFFFPIFIVFNFYIFQSIFILERAKYSLVAGSLLFLTVMVRFFDKKISLITAAVASSIIFTFFNGGSWLGLPLFGGLIVIVICTLIFILFGDIREKRFKRSLNFLLFLILTGVLFLLINSYSLIPYLQTFLKKDYQIIQSSLALQANKAWLDYISQGSSFLNIFRMQGVPDWYVTKFTPSQMHPFASFYMENPLSLVISYLFPIIAFSALVFAKTPAHKKMIGLIGIVALISMVFMAGTRSPVGFIYEFLYEHIPGFIIFRSSFYKFGYAFIIAYAFLLSFSLSLIIEILVKKLNKQLFVFAQVILMVGIVISWFFYHHKLFNTNIFNWRSDFSTRIKIPEYVNEYKNFVKNDNIAEGRVLLVPPFHEVWLSDGYNWGYWSLSTIHYSLTKQPVLANSQNLTRGEGEWVELLYSSIRNKDQDKTLEIAERLGVKKILLKKDSLFNKQWSAGENPNKYEEILNSFDIIKQRRQFGDWVLYEIGESDSSLVTATNSLIELKLDDISKIKPFIEKSRIYIQDHNVNHNEDPLNEYTERRIELFPCKSCVIEDSITIYQLIWPRILPNSLLFNLKIWNEDFKLKKINDVNEKVAFYLGLFIKRASEIDAMFYYKIHDRYVIDNLEKMNIYLEEITRLTEQIHDPYNDFDAAKNTLDNIQSVELKLSEQLSSDKSGIRSQVVKDEIAKTIWQINKLKKFYSPIIDNLDEWQRKKIFEIDIPNIDSYSLYLNEQSLSQNIDGQIILPKIVLEDEHNTKISLLTEKKGNFIPINMSQFKPGKNKLALQFAEPANLLQIEGNLNVETPEGKRRCYRARINSLTTKKAYLIRVKTTGQSIRIYTKKDNIDELTSFLEWKDEMRVDGYFDNEYYKALYTPIATVDKFSIYICGDHQDLPTYKEFIINEIYEPEIIGVEILKKEKGSLPEISSKRINPSRFEIQIKSAKQPFILVFNQRFSPLWGLIDESGNEIGNQHFSIDMYANAWVIDREGDYNLVIEYKPQRNFQIGILISVISLLAIITFFVINNLRRK